MPTSNDSGMPNETVSSAFGGPNTARGSKGSALGIGDTSNTGTIG